MDWGSATFGDALRTHRVRARLTQQELAERAGVSVRAVRYIEQGRVARPRRESVRRLAEVVGLTVDEGALWPRWTGDGRPDGLRIGVLGRLEVRCGGQPVELGPLKQRCLFALLALQPNRVVPREEIIDLLWGDRPPASCQNLVHTYVSRLRKVTECARPRPETALVSSGRGGYQLAVDGEQLDLVRFDELATGARQAAQRGDAEPALALYEQALRLWRSPVLADLPAGVRHHPAAIAVSGRRLATALAYADTALGLGRYQPVVEQLNTLAHEEPLHEGLHARLMLALAGSGQQAAALRLFAEMRSRLADDLGIEPGSEVAAAHLRIVRNDVSTPAPAGAAWAPNAAPTPAQLPADVSGFTGREEHLRQLDAVLPATDTEPSTAVVIAAIAGTAGVGKTALAVHWAHRVRDRFPDGQLYVNLRGYASDSPVRPVEALTRFLHALGLPTERVPVDEEEAVGLYRTLLADRKMLILLDNAASADQVRPLLPGSASCLVLVTSRDSLAGLAAREGARRITLDVLDRQDAGALLARMIGEDRAAEERDAVAELAKACAYLPLALRIVAANLASLPHTSVADYVDELGNRGRLTELVIDGDERDAVRAAFDISYDTLAPGACRLFRLLGLVPGPDFTADAAAALTATDVRQARRLLGQLAGAHLIHEHAAARYQFHDLLQEYAADRARSEDGGAGTRAATTRLYEFYLHTTDAATRLLYPHVQRMPAVGGGPQAPEPPALTAETATAWLDTELTNLVAAVRACPPGMRRYAWQIADSLRGYFVARGHSTEGLASCHAALAAAEHEHDQRAEASINDILGLIHYNLSDYPKAIGYHSRALALSRRAGNQLAEAACLHNLGRVQSQLGKPAQASLYYEQALTINRQIGNRHGEAAALHYIGVAWLSLGRPDRAIALHTQALALSKQIDAKDVYVLSVNGLGLAHWARGQLDQATRFHQEFLDLCRKMGHRHGEAAALICLAETNCDAGRYQEAREQAQQAITKSRRLGDRRYEVGGLDVLATVYQCLGLFQAADRLYAEALLLTREIGFGYGETSVLIGLAGVRRNVRRLPDAVVLCRDALAIMRSSGMRLLEARALIELANSHLELGELEQAATHAELALKVARERRQRLAEARARHVLGRVRHAVYGSDAATPHWEYALATFTELGVPEAREVRTRLGTEMLSQGSGATQDDH